MTDDDAKDMHRLAVGGPVLTPLERELLAALQALLASVDECDSQDGADINKYQAAKQSARAVIAKVGGAA